MKRSAFWAGNPCVGLFVSCLVGLQMMRMPPNQALHLTAAASSVFRDSAPPGAAAREPGRWRHEQYALLMTPP
jgi:hypothetical protein